MYHDCMFLSIDVLTGGAVFSIFVIFPIYSPRPTVVFSSFRLNLFVLLVVFHKPLIADLSYPLFPSKYRCHFFVFPLFCAAWTRLRLFFLGILAYTTRKD